MCDNEATEHSRAHRGDKRRDERCRARRGFISGALGCILLAAALALAIYCAWDETRAGSDSSRALDSLGAAIAGGSSTSPLAGPLPELEIDGTSYVGIIELPTLGLRLPVGATADDAALAHSPGRYTGSAYDGNLVIAGHSYRSHFGRLTSLQPGDLVVFTDILGNSFRYEVAMTEVLGPTDVSGMTESGYPLTLFTCTWDSSRRFTVRCSSASPESIV